jgi:hypothetical protein
VIPRRLPGPALAAAATLAMACSATACSSSAPPAATRRAEVVTVGPASIRLLPAEGQPAYCLAFTIAEKGIVRHLTMSEENESLPCPAHAPVGGTAYRIPPAEGRVRVYLVFSDRKLDARPIAAQMHDLGASPGFSAMDLRAPGNVLLEKLEFTPR